MQYMQYQSFQVAFLILLLAIALDAQWPDRLYPFRELTDEMRARIDLGDGSVEDWEEILGEPTLTPLDFVTHPGFPSEYDPSSFDFRIWLAWHGAGNHLFVAAEIVDDIYAGEWPGLAAHSPHEATVHFSVDGDRSGGTVVETEDHVVFEDMTMDQAQEYWAVAENVAENNEKGSNVFLMWVGTDSPWVQELPYADGGGSVLDSQPVFYVIEFYVTAFDRLIRDVPEESLVSELFTGKMIGFAMKLNPCYSWNFSGRDCTGCLPCLGFRGEHIAELPFDPTTQEDTRWVNYRHTPSRGKPVRFSRLSTAPSTSKLALPTSAATPVRWCCGNCSNTAKS